MARKPRVVGRGNTGLAAADCSAEGDNVKGDALRVLKEELAAAGPCEAVLLAGNTVETPRAEPVIGGIALSREGADMDFGFGEHDCALVGPEDCLHHGRHRQASCHEKDSSPQPRLGRLFGKNTLIGV